MLPKGMQRKEWCDVCFKEMELDNSRLNEEDNCVEVQYKCKCGYKITFAYYGGFVDAYKQQKDYPNQPSPTETSAVVEQSGTQEKGAKG
jgi:hypothetical protein